MHPTVLQPSRSMKAGMKKILPPSCQKPPRMSGPYKRYYDHARQKRHRENDEPGEHDDVDGLDSLSGLHDCKKVMAGRSDGRYGCKSIEQPRHTELLGAEQARQDGRRGEDQRVLNQRG